MKSRIVRQNGQLMIEIDGVLHSALSFKSFRPNPTNIREFYTAGVRLFDVLSSGVLCGLGVPYSRFGESWVGEYEYDFAPIDRQMEMFVENAPEGYFAPMFQIDTRPWYLEQHPDAPNSFTHLSQIAGDEDFRKAAAAYLKAVIRHCEETWGERIYGYFLLGGTTTEWFSDLDYETSHPFKEAAWQRWCGDETARLPQKELLEREGSTFLLPEEDEVYRARRFHAELIAELILHLCAEVQSVLHHEKLLGLYYGYLFELGSPRLHNAGSLGYEKVFLSPDVDMISSPSSYAFRGLDDPSAFMTTWKTLDAHNKLYFNEFDHRTHTIPQTLAEPVQGTDNLLYLTFPGYEDRCRCEQDSVNLLYRDFLLCQSTGAVMWWFDMFDGWFRSEGMLNAIANMMRIDRELQALPRASAAEIAVFAEGESMYRVRKSSGAADGLAEIRRPLAQLGAPSDWFSIADLASPASDGYRLYIFLNQYTMSDETRAAAMEKCRRAGAAALWLYAPGYACDGANDPARIAAFTGMHTTQSDTPHGGLRLPDGNLFPCEDQAPYFAVEDPAAQPLTYYADGTVAVASAVHDGVRQYYAGVYRLPAALLRHIAAENGVFVYSDDEQVYTYAGRAFLGVYKPAQENARIRVRQNGRYTDRLTGQHFTAENGVLILPPRALRAYMLFLTE